jgi:hypothetical protein
MVDFALPSVINQVTPMVKQSKLFDTVSRNVCNQLPTYTAYYPRRAKASTTPLRKPEVSQDDQIQPSQMGGWYSLAATLCALRRSVCISEQTATLRYIVLTDWFL